MRPHLYTGVKRCIDNTLVTIDRTLLRGVKVSLQTVRKDISGRGGHERYEFL